MCKCTTGVVGRIDECALNFSCEFLLEGFQCEQVVSRNESVVKNVSICDPMCGMVRLSLVFSRCTWRSLSNGLLISVGSFFSLIREGPEITEATRLAKIQATE